MFVRLLSILAQSSKEFGKYEGHNSLPRRKRGRLRRTQNGLGVSVLNPLINNVIDRLKSKLEQPA